MSWRFFIHLNEKEKYNIHIDSISLSFCCWCFGVKKGRLSGVHYYNEMKDTEAALYLVARQSDIFNNEIVLPYWTTLDSISLDEELIKSCRNFSCIILGIASPKQDVLARLIQKECPDADIYCLGAAISSLKIDTVFDSLGLGWFSMGIRHPLRFYQKIVITIRESVKIFIDQDIRKEFRSFLENLN